MDAVSLETPQVSLYAPNDLPQTLQFNEIFLSQENEFIKQRIARGNVRYIWTSGRKCNFAGCDRTDLQPPNENGWFWSGSGAKIGKYINGTNECYTRMAVMNDVRLNRANLSTTNRRLELDWRIWPSSTRQSRSCTRW